MKPGAAGLRDPAARFVSPAFTYKRLSAEMEKAWANMSPGRIIDGVIGIAGGLPIKVGDETIGAIGAPGGDKDEACAAAGIAKAADALK
jgi:uncharacterized protein GlcG (DUF336 family)